MTDAEQALTFSMLEDARALIAALKMQRWEALKWTVTVNLAVATASVALREAAFLFSCLAVCVAMLGLFLVWHYNQRATQVRERHRATVEFLKKEIFDFNSKIGINVGAPKGSDYDKEELVVFRIAIVGSALPALLVMLVK